jgi:hypothetical protein
VFATAAAAAAGYFQYRKDGFANPKPVSAKSVTVMGITGFI